MKSSGGDNVQSCKLKANIGPYRAMLVGFEGGICTGRSNHGKGVSGTDRKGI